ncbi:MAG: DNA recombination protein RmuC [Alphaproteobacteria bacterium]|nr:DNA recombination protein RmuC [Alphaproteobacteria bacterium]
MAINILILLTLVIVIVMLGALLMRKPVAPDISPQMNKLNQILSERLGALSQNAADLKNISGDIANFKNILMGNKQARGAFGEKILEDLVSDIMPPESYEFQSTLDGGARPDVIIKLPYPPGDMAIDSKFPLEGYAKMQNSGTENEREMARREFKIAIRTHIDAIANKYIISGKTADSAMMFIGAESIFEVLHREFPDEIDYAHRKKVFIVSPATLWASLNTIRAVLSDIKIKRVAGEIKKELDMLLSDLGRLSDRADKVEKSFNNSVDALKDLNISINKITPRAEKLKALDFE